MKELALVSLIFLAILVFYSIIKGRIKNKQNQ